MEFFTIKSWQGKKVNGILQALAYLILVVEILSVFKSMVVGRTMMALQLKVYIMIKKALQILELELQLKGIQLFTWKGQALL